jgi:glycine oxidase
VPRSPDIVIVGAGIIGAAVAYELTRRGAAVRVLDDRPAGMGATQASAGVLAPYIEARHDGPLLDLTSRGLDLFDEVIPEVAAASGMTITYRRTGSIDVALAPDTVVEYRDTASALARRGVQAELLDARQVREAEPLVSADVVGGLLIPSHGFVEATELARAFMTAAERSGAQRVGHGRVRRIAVVGSGSSRCVRVDTDHDTLTASQVVLAAGSWSGQVVIDGVAVPVPVRPVRGQLLHLAWNGPPIKRVTWGERCYLVPWPDGTLLVGATVEEAGFDERTTAAGVRDLIEAACELAPHGWTAALKSARAGLRPGTPDGLPVIGRSEVLPELVYATGHYRNGVLLAPLTARLVADAILESREDPLLAEVRPGRFGRV